MENVTFFSFPRPDGGIDNISNNIRLSDGLCCMKIKFNRSLNVIRTLTDIYASQKYEYMDHRNM